MATTNRIAVAARWSEKYFFSPNSRKVVENKKKMEKTDKFKAFCFSSKLNKY